MEQHEAFLMTVTTVGIVYCLYMVCLELGKGLKRWAKRRRIRRALRGRK